jgi:sterol desaturase/sphingolipid hydroxylase (fatty acid hydroxylase superfamily)
MDDLIYGKRDKRGHWTPKDALTSPPVFVLPPQPLAFLKWLPSYFLPWNVVFMSSALAFWFFLTPDMETMKTLRPGWMLWILARNVVAVLLFYGAFELRLYKARKQQGRFKYNPSFPSDTKSDVFWFGSQNVDNMIRSFGTGVPIWSAYEIGILWAFANGYAPMGNFAANPVWLGVIALLTPMFHEFHFYLIHRMIHIPVLYKWVHSVHHNSVNPSPWSSLSMHPVEHLLYFSGSLIHLVIHSHPLLAIYHLHLAGFGAVVGHVGFDKIETSEQRGVDTHSFVHYLHHKYFEVNYADGLIPLDRWFGTWHDGTKAGQEAMDRRWKKKMERLNARKAAQSGERS